MAGKRIGDHQVGIYKKLRTKLGQEVAAAKVGISVRSARRLDEMTALPSQREAHTWRTRADPFEAVWQSELVPMLELMAPDFVQTDCKGHPGYTSWFSQVANASVPAGLKQDALMQWRQATRKLGLPLHCHYSGVWDKAAGAKCILRA